MTGDGHGAVHPAAFSDPLIGLGHVTARPFFMMRGLPSLRASVRILRSAVQMIDGLQLLRDALAGPLGAARAAEQIRRLRFACYSPGPVEQVIAGKVRQRTYGRFRRSRKTCTHWRSG
jgi:hypothetical protein